MKISVITCTWNSAHYLPESLASVVGQDHPDIEYIFVDGGSTDGTLQLIQSLQRPYTLLRGVTGGVSRAMNAGIAAATGDVIAHLHSDDYYLHGGVLSRVARCFQESGARWVAGRMHVLEGGQLIEASTRRQDYSYTALAAGRFHFVHPSTFVARAVFAELGAFEEGLKYSMDWDMWFRIASLAPPAVLHEALTVFRVHTGSLSTSSPGSRLLARQEEMQVRMRYARRAPVQTAVWLCRYWVRMRRLKRAMQHIG